MKRFVRNFVNGCLVLVPTVATLYVIYLVFSKVDGLLGRHFTALMGVEIPGLGFVVTVGLIAVIGGLATNVLGKRLFDVFDGFLARTPLVKLIYTSLRDFMGALVGERRSFDRPVTVDLGSDLRVFGFITREDLSGWGLKDHIAVYVPQSINFAGQLLLLPRERVSPLSVDTAELLPFVVSGGMAGGSQ
jgi:uncharacterized membrane protein